MRVVIDTNIFVSSFFGGNARKIVDLWIDNKITLCLSRKIIDEYIRVLEHFGLHNETELDEILSLFARGFNSLFAGKTPDLQIIESDPEDNKFIECAVALHACCIISGDQDIIDIQDYMGIQCFTPKQFLDYYDHKSRI